MNENMLNQLLGNYYDLKESEKSITAKLKPLNEEIKQFFLENNIEKFDNKDFDYRASISKTEKVSWIEPILIERLKKLGFEDCVKTKEYVDMAMFESYLYNGKLKEAKIKDCKNINEIISLRVSKR